jgi:tight adherence protein C
MVAGLGAALVWLRLPWWRRPRLEDRLAPYLRDVVPASRLLAAPPAPRSPWGALESLLAPVMSDAVRWVERLSGGTGRVRRRLDQLGAGMRVEQFRAEQVVWGVLGAAGGVLLGVTGVVVGSGDSALTVVGLLAVGALLGVFGRDQVLTSQVQRREQRMLAEFPTVAELLALSVGAGEGAVGALERVSRTCTGELSAELRRTLAEAHAGASLVQALDQLSTRTGLPVLARFVDGVAVAIERGTPLAEVLRAQAQDVREASRRRLIEIGGRKEISMMVPVVFFVLPVTVLFAVYPGLAVLDLHI